jgi:hypothetical protein
VARGRVTLALSVIAVTLLALATPTAAPRSRVASGAAAIATGQTRPVGKWGPNAPNVYVVTGRVMLGGRPVAGVRVRVDRWVDPVPTPADGSFTYEADSTALGRHPVSIADDAHGRIGSVALTTGQQAVLRRARGAITVAYAIRNLHAVRKSHGKIVVSGRIAYADGTAPPRVVLYSYRLSGRILDARGKPVVGARISTRTLDRDFWTVSGPSGADGRYDSLFTASSEAPGNPVPFSVRVAIADRVYQFLPEEYVYFPRLRSARMDIELPPSAYPMALPQPVSYQGAVYDGVLVGAALGATPVRPLAATWPDATGAFTLTLPASTAGRTLSLWEDKVQLFSRLPARPGGAVDLREWPTTLGRTAAVGIATIHLPG